MSVAVVGCGYWGQNLLRNFHSLGQLSLVCESDPAGQARAAQIAPGIPQVSDFEQLLETNVPAVVIATPAESHYQLTSRALRAGKHVFVEKPLALTFREGAELVTLSQQMGRILMVGHILEYHPACRALLNLVQSGDLGTLYYIYSNRLSLGKVRREENSLWSFAPHDVAAILRLMGEMPIQVNATGGSYLQANIADVTLTTLRFANGVRAHIHVSWLHPFKEQRLVVIGSQRMAVFNGVENTLVAYDQRVEIRDGEPIPVRGPGQSLDFAKDEPLQLECQAFIEAVASRTPPLTDGLSGLRVLAVLEMAQRSLVHNGQMVDMGALVWPDHLATV